MRLPWIAAAAVVGAAAGLVVAALQSPPYRATVSFVVAPSLRSTAAGVPTLTRTAAQLVRTRSVAQNVIDALHLSETPDELLREMSVRTHAGTAVVEVGVSQPTSVGAQRVAQQVLVVFEGLANSRLGRVGTGPAVSVWDAAGNSTTREGKAYAADGIAGGSLGLLAALALVVLRRPRRRTGTPPRAAEPPRPEPVPEPVPVSVPVPMPEPEPAVAAPAQGTLAELERRVRAETDPTRREELTIYLEQLRSFADPDGSLPPNLVGLAEDVFGEL